MASATVSGKGKCNSKNNSKNNNKCNSNYEGPSLRSG